MNTEKLIKLLNVALNKGCSRFRQDGSSTFFTVDGLGRCFVFKRYTGEYDLSIDSVDILKTQDSSDEDKETIKLLINSLLKQSGHIQKFNDFLEAN